MSSGSGIKPGQVQSDLEPAAAFCAFARVNQLGVCGATKTFKGVIRFGLQRRGACRRCEVSERVVLTHAIKIPNLFGNDMSSMILISPNDLSSLILSSWLVFFAME